MFEISWSKTRTWRRCHRQYWYKYFERLARKRPKVGLFKGRILHEMLDARATGLDWRKVLTKYETEYRKMFLEQREEYGDLIPELTRIFEAYERHYADEKLKYVSSELFIATQLTKRIRFLGYIDKVVEADARLWNIDHKTGRTLPDEDTRFSDLQIVFYNWAHNRERPSTKLGGVIWDYLKTKPPAIPEVLKNGQLSQRANIDTDHWTYLNAIKQNKLDPNDYAEILSDLKGRSSTFFKRVRLPNPPSVMVEQVVEDLKATATQIMHLGGISKVRTMQRDCKSCEFFSICHAELRGQDAEFVRKAEYIVKDSNTGESLNGDEEEPE